MLNRSGLPDSYVFSEVFIKAMPDLLLKAFACCQINVIGGHDIRDDGK